MGSIVVYDLGNTRTKVGYFAKRPQAGTYASCNGYEAWPTGGRAIHPGCVPDAVVVGSVVPAATEPLIASMPDGWAEPIVATPEMFGLELDVDAPERVGVDRVANVAAAFALTGETSIVVDVGTAATVDAVVRRGDRGVFVGGAILPGLQLMASSLTNRTAELPAIDPATDVVPLPGHNTVDAITAGVQTGFRGALTEVVRRMQDATGCEDRNVAIEGGDLPFVRDWFPNSGIREGGLTLSGLALVHPPA